MVLSSHFLSQLVSDILKKGKLKRLDDGPQIPRRDLLNMTFGVFNEMEDQERTESASLDRQQYQLLPVALGSMLMKMGN